MKTNDASTSQKKKRFARERFNRAQRLERDYLRYLRQVANQVDALVKGSAAHGIFFSMPELRNMLESYSKLLRPWAKKVAGNIISEIAKKNESSWAQLGSDMSRNLRREIQGAPTGEALRRILDEQVELITSLPLVAAERVHKLTIEAATDSTRASEIAKEILKTGEVALSRAKLIARTEVARTASVLTQARSEAVGATHYTWRTSGDSDVRDSHKQMEGKIFAWNSPPEVEPGKYYHAGQFPNCRCYPEPLIPEE